MVAITGSNKSQWMWWINEYTIIYSVVLFRESINQHLLNKLMGWCSQNTQIQWDLCFEMYLTFNFGLQFQKPVLSEKLSYCHTEAIKLFLPCSIIFNKFRCFIIAIENGKSYCHFIPFSLLTSCYISKNVIISLAKS